MHKIKKQGTQGLDYIYVLVQQLVPSRAARCKLPEISFIYRALIIIHIVSLCYADPEIPRATSKAKVAGLGDA